MHVRAQNAAVIIRILVDHVRFEVFEVCPPTSNVMSTSGKLLCSYPGPALQISSDIFSDKSFLQELSSFLIQMDVDELDSGATTVKAGSIVREVRDSAHPKYISQLLVGILRGFGGQPASVDRITKRIGDEVLWEDAYKPWRRSPLWLVIRVALQTSLDYDIYKTFILFFHAYLLHICVKRGFSSETLYLMRVKVARRHLDSWVDSSKHDDNAPDVIASCVEQYHDNAAGIYRDSPEDKSVMLLTIMDLWMALDKLTVQQCPLMACYSPEIPRDFLHPLLLHRSGSLKRASLIERYISRRHEKASCRTSIFSDSATVSSFAVRYFGDSSELKQLYADINDHAKQQREEKRVELSALNEKWQSLMDEALRMTHSHINDYNGKLIHAHYCQKCVTHRAADMLRIDVFEWPLPRATMQAQLVVFELSPPRAFSVWREMTYKILCDIGTRMPTRSAFNNAGRAMLLLDDFSGLRQWAVRHEYHRITLGSTTKSFCDQTHYKEVRIPASEPQVLLDNGLSFKLYDRRTRCWAAQSFLGTTIANFCVPHIPISSPYAKFHSYVTGTHHTSNEVIAAQGDCPSELSPHEYLAFSGLRIGPRLQWLNIARELSSPWLSFRREEVHTLITQAAWHLGPLSDGVHEWHTDLGIPSFGRTLLRELEDLLGRIESNWLEEVTIRSIGTSESTLFCLPLP